jgi:sensor domain CHASE-containing protein
MMMNGDQYNGRRRAWWVWIPGIFGLLASVLLWWEMGRIDGLSLHRHTMAVQEGLIDGLKHGLKLRVEALIRMAARWRGATEEEHRRWRADASAMIRDLPGIQALEWVGRDHRVRWIEPLGGNEPALGLDLSREAERRAALETAKESGGPIFSRPI